MICTMAVGVINDIVKFAKRARITATLTSKVPLHVSNTCGEHRFSCTES